MKVLIDKFDQLGDVKPGYVFTTNDPYWGGMTHLNDIIAWTANIAHNSDVGGLAPGSLSGDAVEIFQEGLRLPAAKVHLTRSSNG